MKILITGGFGFIGGRLAKYLASRGHKILLGSRIVRSHPEWGPCLEVVKTDWDNEDSLINLCRNVDAVIHSAGMNAYDCETNPVAALDFNGVSTSALVKASCKAGVKKIIYFSTAHVYSSPFSGVLTEETCPANLHPYATSHLAGENAVLWAHQQKQIEGWIFRLSNSFGAPTHKNVNTWNLLVNDICRQAMVSKKIILKSNGTQYRDFVALSSVEKTIEISLLDSAPPSCNLIFNLGSGRPISIMAMAELVAARYQNITGEQIRIEKVSDDANKAWQPFLVSVEKLKMSGLFFESINEPEIDELLLFCKRCFEKS
ncbi:MAG TPA: SDR family oxidoreductase [Sediminibacterium sp.]